MSFRDDSSSTFHGGGGYAGNGNPGSNGGVGGGMGGGFGGGGGARNGGFNSSTGLTTGTSFSGKQTGRPGGISEQLAALFRPAQPKMNRPNVARPVTQPPLPTYVEPPPVIEDVPPPVYDVPPEVVPGFDQPYKPPQQVNLSPTIFDKPPNMNNGVYGGWGHTAIAGGLGASRKYQDRVGGGPGVSGGDRFGKK